MKRLTCYLLEGLRRQGPHQVWITIGAFNTLEAAQLAATTPTGWDVAETRILPLYRDSGSVPQPHSMSFASATATSEESVTVA